MEVLKQSDLTQPITISSEGFNTDLGRFPIFLRDMAKRKRSLTNGKPLDKIHFHYFENDHLDDALSNFGEIENKFIIPGRIIVLFRAE